MQAIQTKFLPCTNTKPSRIKAWCDAGSLTLSYAHEFEESDAHAYVAKKLSEKLGWTGKYYSELIGGSLPGNNGYCFVFSNTK